MSNTIYERASETAKKVRKALKEEFPGVKFSVRSSEYSGGSSIHVSWTDGPINSLVDSILNKFESANFDGMTDMKECHGYKYEDKVYNGADYIFSNRALSNEYRTKIKAIGEQMFGDWKGNNYQIDKAEAELNKEFPYNRMASK